MKRIYTYTLSRGFTPVFVLLVLLMAASVGYAMFNMSRQSIDTLDTTVKAESDVGTFVEVTKIDKNILENSSYIGPFILSVLRSDGSFSYAVVTQADLVDDAFVGTVQVQYPNGDFGSVADIKGEVGLFFTKKGNEEKVAIVDRIITGVRLPDDSILPVKFRDASIRNGKLVGDFQFYAFADKKQVNGRFTPRGELTSLVVQPSLVSADSTSLLVMRELLKLFYVHKSTFAKKLTKSHFYHKY